MRLQREWSVTLSIDPDECVSAALYEIEKDGQYRLVSDETFGPFDTAEDVVRWLTRHWSGSARRPLR